MSRKHFSLFHSFFLHTIKWKRHWKNYLIYWVFSKNSFDESLKKSYEFSKNLNDTILQCCSVYEEFKIYFVFWYYRHLRNNHFFFLAYYSFKKWIVKKKKTYLIKFLFAFFPWGLWWFSDSIKYGDYSPWVNLVICFALLNMNLKFYGKFLFGILNLKQICWMRILLISFQTAFIKSPAGRLITVYKVHLKCFFWNISLKYFGENYIQIKTFC